MAIGMLLLSVSLTISSRLINVTHICKATNVVTAIIVFEDNQSVALISGKKIQSVAGSMTDCIWSIQNYLQDSHTVQSSKRKCALCNSSICPKGVWEAWKSWGCHYIHSLGFPKTSQTWEDRFGDWLCNPLSGIKICTKSFAASCKMKTALLKHQAIDLASTSGRWPLTRTHVACVSQCDYELQLPTVILCSSPHREMLSEVGFLLGTTHHAAQALEGVTWRETDDAQHRMSW